MVCLFGDDSSVDSLAKPKKSDTLSRAPLNNSGIIDDRFCVSVFGGGYVSGMFLLII
jgi:hypothetical protein